MLRSDGRCRGAESKTAEKTDEEARAAGRRPADEGRDGRLTSRTDAEPAGKSGAGTRTEGNRSTEVSFQYCLI